MKKPLVALVGRPNVGKSSLFNRLVGTRKAVVADVPGTTRDRLIDEAEWRGVLFDVVDTGGLEVYQPKEGAASRSPLEVGSRFFTREIRNQALLAIEEADVIVLVTDTIQGLTAADEEVAEVLRRTSKPVLVAANKADNAERRDHALEFYALGVGEVFPISALHGTGTGDLLDAVVEALPFRPSPDYDEDEDDETLKIAIVGRPNVGKSSLLNKLLGQERAIVSPVAGTTRDAVDTALSWQGMPITLIDTAGIRRRGRVEPGIEKYSVLRAHRAIERADVVLLLIDAVEGITQQDAHIAGMVRDAFKSVVVVVNKWDAIEKDTHTMKVYQDRVREALNFMPYVPVLFISAKTGQRVHQVLETAVQVQEERMVRIPTGELNRIIREAMLRHPPQTKQPRPLKIFLAQQVRVDPPTILLHVNDRDLLHFTYERYLENQIRRVYPFTGTPIRFVVRERRRKKNSRR